MTAWMFGLNRIPCLGDRGFRSTVGGRHPHELAFRWTASFFVASILSFPAIGQPVAPTPPIVGDVFQQYRVAQIAEPGWFSSYSMVGVATDAEGTISTVANTPSPDLTVKNSAQPTIGGA